MNHETRELLGAVRICRPHDSGVARALIPTDLAHWFTDVNLRGGFLWEVNVREELIRVAEAQVGVRYYNRASPPEAPEVFSCSTLALWVAGHVGVWLPRYAIDQSYVGIRSVGTRLPGTFGFFQNRFPIHDPDRSIGHVVICKGDGTVIHGSARAGRVTHESLPSDPIRFMDPLPRSPHLILNLDNAEFPGCETALDVARALQPR